MDQDQRGVLCSIYNNIEQRLFIIILKQQQYDKKYMIWMKRIESKRPRVVYYWNTSEVKEEKLKCNLKERMRKNSHTMQLNKHTKWRKLNRGEIKNYNQITEIKILKK